MSSSGGWSRKQRGKFKGKLDANAIPIDVIVAFYGGQVRQGRNLSVKCVMHNDSRASASIDTFDNFYNCFTCGKGGNAVNVVQQIENLEFKDALNRAIEILDRSGESVRGSSGRGNTKVSRRSWNI